MTTRTTKMSTSQRWRRRKKCRGPGETEDAGHRYDSGLESPTFLNDSEFCHRIISSAMAFVRILIATPRAMWIKHSSSVGRTWRGNFASVTCRSWNERKSAFQHEFELKSHYLSSGWIFYGNHRLLEAVLWMKTAVSLLGSSCTRPTHGLGA